MTNARKRFTRREILKLGSGDPGRGIAAAVALVAYDAIDPDGLGDVRVQIHNHAEHGIDVKVIDFGQPGIGPHLKRRAR